MSAKRVFFSVFQKIMVFCCAMFFGFADAFSANLPAGYTELEYIESTGTQYIDTGVALNAVDKVTGKVEFTALPSSTIAYIAGGRGVNNKAIGYALYTINHSGFTIYNAGWLDRGANISTGQVLEFETLMGNSQQSFVVNGNIVLTGNTSIGGYKNSNVIYLFSLGSEYKASAKMYSIKFYSGTTLVADFVSARRNSDNVLGMYDTVNNVFYTNAGTGEFTAGPEVLNPCRNLFDENSNLNTHIPCAVAGNYPSINATTPRPNARTYFMTVKPNTTYTISMSSVGDRLYVFGINDIINPYDYTNDNRLSFNRTILSYQSTIPTTVTFTTNSTEKMVAVYYALENIPTHFQIEQGSTATAYAPYCVSPIKIATTAYNTARFSPVVNDLNSTVATIRDIVTNTINQTAAIASLQADKQTRPEDACPAGKKCLLVETEENGVIVPHWFPIIESPEDN